MGNGVKQVFYIASISQLYSTKEDYVGEVYTQHEINDLNLGFYRKLPFETETVITNKTLKFRRLSEAVFYFINEYIKSESHDEVYESYEDYFIRRVEPILYDLLQDNVIVKKNVKDKTYTFVDDQHIRNTFFQVKNQTIEEGAATDIVSSSDILTIYPQNSKELKGFEDKVKKRYKKNQTGYIKFFSSYLQPGNEWKVEYKDNQLYIGANEAEAKSFPNELVGRFYTNDVILLFVDTKKSFNNEKNYFEVYAYKIYVDEEYSFHYENVKTEELGCLFVENFDIADNLIFADETDNFKMGIDFK